MSLLLRPYTPADFDTLLSLDQACYPAGIAYSKRILLWFLNQPGAYCVVAEEDGTIAGFVLVEHEAEQAHLITIDVLEAARRRGIGTMLLDTIEHTLAARGARAIELETATDNHAAVAFWKKHGYRTMSVLKRYYLNRIDAFSMRKPLAAPKES
jgi:ribosomal protein S18 acetylase RimI-like enzyme